MEGSTSVRPPPIHPSQPLSLFGLTVSFSIFFKRVFSFDKQLIFPVAFAEIVGTKDKVVACDDVKIDDDDQ